MLSNTMADSGDQNPAAKRMKVDSPVTSRNVDCGTGTFSPVNSPYASQKRSSCEPLTPPPRQKARSGSRGVEEDEEHNVITAEDVSPEGTVASRSSKSCSAERADDADGDVAKAVVAEVLREEGHPPAPADNAKGSSSSAATTPWRSSTRPSAQVGAAASPTTAATTSTSVSVPPLPVSTNGAITTLRSLSQLALLVSSANTASAKERTHPSLRLKPGESVMLLLYFDEASLRPLVSAATSELSQMRVFTLNLAKLPPQDYEAGVAVRRSGGSGGSVVFLSSTAAAGGGAGESERAKAVVPQGAAAPAPSTTAAAQHATGVASDEEEEDEEELVPAVHPMAVSAAAAEVAERAPRGSTTGAALTLDEAVSVSSLSGDLQHASEVVGEKLRQLLSVDTILNPHASQQHSTAVSGSDGGSASKREPLLFPAMIVWRAAGAPREEYPPAPPQTYSSQPSATPAELFCDRMAAQGGPLVVKEATSIDQVHSLTLFRPVYTMENLFRTLVHAVAPSFASKAAGEKSRTVLYLGASWCPPCMRFVHEMPQFMREDLPSSVVCTMKADMDLAKPIYDYFKVEIIPTFVVLDNEVLMQCFQRLQQRGVVAGSAGCGGASQSEYLRSIQDAFSKAELARLQNSNRQLVSTFVSKHSQALSFDEDF